MNAVRRIAAVTDSQVAHLAQAETMAALAYIQRRSLVARRGRALGQQDLASPGAQVRLGGSAGPGSVSGGQRERRRRLASSVLGSPVTLS